MADAAKWVIQTLLIASAQLMPTLSYVYHHHYYCLATTTQRSISYSRRSVAT